MKVLTVVIVALAFSTSVWAQGELSTLSSYGWQIVPTTTNPFQPFTGDLSAAAGAESPVIITPSFQSQSTFMEVQAVPEPTPFALVGLAIGVTSLRQIVRKQRSLK